MLNLQRKIIRNIIKLKQSKNTIKQSIQKFFICQECNGKGYYTKNNKYELCNSCSGIGMKHYTYF